MNAVEKKTLSLSIGHSLGLLEVELSWLKFCERD